MNCKICNAELKEDALFCQACGTKVEDDLAEMKDDAENNVYAEQTNHLETKAKAKLTKKQIIFGALGIVAVILVVASGICTGISSIKSNSAETSKSKNSTSASKSGSSSTSKTGSSSSSGALTEDLKKTMVASALMSEIKTKFPIADAGSTKYKINKTEQKDGYTIVYGTLHLYDKYGKATTGRSDKSGSYTRTFEVKISNSTKRVSSCTIK